MPLLDAVLAFCLTMLAVASLSSLLVDWCDRWRAVRADKLKTMLLDFVTRRTLRAVRRAEGYAAAQGERLQTELVDELRARGENDPPAVEAARDWARKMGIADLVERIDVEKEAAVAGDEVLEAVKSSPFFAELVNQADERLDAFVEELEEQWKRLEEEYVALFRRRAQVYNTAICLVLAFAFNIDSVHLLNVYMEDEATREAVIAQQSTQMSDASPAGGEEAEKEPVTWGEVRQQAEAFQQSPFPIGWDQFPNCPPRSVDPRCLAYWQADAGSLDLSELSYGERLALNPATFWKGLRTPDASAVAWGHLVAPLGAWLFGCLGTALLAGLGSSFWFEIVRRLSTFRESLRRDNLEGRQRQPEPKRPVPEGKPMTGDGPPDDARS